jgi:excisionase family DNA binding protein
VKPLLTTREVAVLLGLSPETVLRLYRKGDLPGIRIGTNVLRFAENDVGAYLAERRSGGVSGSSCGGAPRAVGSPAPEGRERSS